MADLEEPGRISGAQSVAGVVFISYASADKITADAVCAALETRDIPCWIAPRDVKPGALYADAIIRAISNAKALVVILSGHSVASAHVGKEVERASSKRRPIITLRIDQAPLTPALEYFLSESQWIEASAANLEAAYQRLQEAIRDPAPLANLATLPAAPMNSVRRAFWKTRTIIVAVTVTAALTGTSLVLMRSATIQHAASPVSASVTNSISDKSIAVMPFTDLSEEKDQAFFSDGMAEEIIDQLEKIPGIYVPARSSSFSFKDKATKLSDIARALGVKNVLEGSVRRAGRHLRVSAQLIRAEDGYHVWSESYDRQMTDILTVQDQIASSVVKALRVSLLSEPPARSISVTASEAYTLYLKGRASLETGDLEALKEAIDYFSSATRLDPDWAPAWASLARALIADYADFGVGSLETIRPVARAAAERAIALDPHLAEAHVALERVLMNLDWNWSAAEEEIRRALELAPANADVARNAFFLSMVLGRFDEATEHAKMATILDPLNADNFLRLAEGEFYLGNLRSAEQHFKKVVELRPGADIHLQMADLLVAQGRSADALLEAEREMDAQWRELFIAYFLGKVGRTDDANRALATAVSKYGKAWPYYIGELYASLGNLDEAFSWWEQAYRQHDGTLISIKEAPIESRAQQLYSDPRYKAFLRKMNFPD